MSEELRSDFAPRDYQSELFQCALKENTIVYLPTGSGKTYIAALVIKEKANETLASLSDGGKRTVFLVPTVALAIQQADYLRRHTPLKVKEYYGSLGVDLNLENKWHSEFENNNVLVMTAQTFADILNHAFFSADKVNLLVFDECHAAVRDSPMMQVLEKLDTVHVEKRPRILGLTATLFRKKCKPNNVMNVVQQLATSMKCTIRTPTDIGSVYRNCTNPCQLILEYESKPSFATPEISNLSKRIEELVKGLSTELTPTNKRKNSDSASSSLMKPLNEILHSLENFGIYGVHHYAQLYLKLLPRFRQRAEKSEISEDCDKVFALLRNISQSCEDVFAGYSSPLDRLLLFVHPRVLRLVELLRQMNPATVNEDIKDLPKMCAIIFVSRRSTALVLFQFLKEISEVDPGLNFVKPLFTTGRGAGRSNMLKESSHQRQTEVVTAFRNGVCNVLVATSVLEEGIDIPACNLIVKFDLAKTYCDYVQAKGRARAKRAYYALMVSDEDSERYTDELLQYHSIEQTLISHQQSNNEDGEIDTDEISDTLVPAYAPYGEDGPRISAQKSITLINRYCAKLSSGMGASLAPQWELKTVELQQVSASWLCRIHEALKKLPKGKCSSGNVELFQCSILLPLNSPLRDEVAGDVMPSKRLAKRSAAQRVCQLLHEMKEFDDVHLLPKVRETTVLDDDMKTIASTQPKMEKHPRQYPECFQNCRPAPGRTSYVYSIDFKLTEPNEAMFFVPEAVNTQFGILSSKPIPPLCRFPLITKAGKVEVDVKKSKTFVLNEEQCLLLESFHKWLFQDVIHLLKEQLTFDLDKSIVQCLLVPLKVETTTIDYEFADKMLNAPKIDWNARPNGDHYDFNPSRFEDAVVVPWYESTKKLKPYYVDSLTSLTPLSSFSALITGTYYSYFKGRNLNITNLEQRLVKVSAETWDKNFLSPRPARMKAKRLITHLVPELCHVHPMPGSVWKQAVWLPSVLHRLYQMLVAEELRVRIHRESLVPKIGVEQLPSGETWKAITIHLKTNAADEAKEQVCSVPEKEDDTKEFELDILEELSDDYSLIDCRSSEGSPPSKMRRVSSNIETKESYNGCQLSKLENGTPEEASPLKLRRASLDLERKDFDDVCQQFKTESGTLEEASPLKIRRVSLNLESQDFDDVCQQFEVEDHCGTPEEASLLEIRRASSNVGRKECDNGCQENKIEARYTEDAMMQMSFDKSTQPFGPSPGQVLEALTLTRTCESFDMERYETLGDSLLKLVTTIYLFGKYDYIDEGAMTALRMKQVSNKNLARLCKQKQLAPMFSTWRLDLDRNFLPPGFLPPATNNDEHNSYMEQSPIVLKNLADSVEALIGLYLTTNGVEGALRVMEWLGLDTLPVCEQCNAVNGLPILRPSPLKSVEFGTRMPNDSFAGLESFEQLLGYKFNNKELLIEAFTHPSYLANRLVQCYQRLEFLGDSVLDYVVTRFFYENPRRFGPGDLTDLRSVTVSNETFAVLAVRYGFHRYLKYESHSLSVAFDRFVRNQEANRHSVLVDYLCFENVGGVMVASNYDVPAVLGEIFESVAGAVFIDSGMSLDAVWRCYLPFLRQELENFSISNPRFALKELNDMLSRKATFGNIEQLKDGRVIVTLEFGEGHIFRGVGCNLKMAKCAAAKHALSVLRQKNITASPS